MSLNTDLNSYQKWFIGNDIREILMSDSAITSGVTNESGETIFNGVGENIFPLVAPENVEGEFIIYQRDKYIKNWTKMGVYEDECQVYVTCVSDSYDKAILLASLVDNALVGKHIITSDKKFFIDLADSTETFDDNKFIETLLLRIK